MLNEALEWNWSPSWNVWSNATRPSLACESFFQTSNIARQHNRSSLLQGNMWTHSWSLESVQYPRYRLCCELHSSYLHSFALLIIWFLSRQIISTARLIVTTDSIFKFVLVFACGIDSSQLHLSVFLWVPDVCYPRHRMMFLFTRNSDRSS